MESNPHPTCRGSLDGVGVVSLGSGLQQERTNVRLPGQPSKVETGVVVLVVPAVGVGALLQQILGHVLLAFPRGVHQWSHPSPVF